MARRERDRVMTRYTKQQLAEFESDSNYWNEFCEAFGWTLNGYTGRSNATIETGRKAVYLPSFSVTGAERDTIMAATAKAAKK